MMRGQVTEQWTSGRPYKDKYFQYILITSLLISYVCIYVYMMSFIYNSFQMIYGTSILV